MSISKKEYQIEDQTLVVFTLIDIKVGILQKTYQESKKEIDELFSMLVAPDEHGEEIDSIDEGTLAHNLNHMFIRYIIWGGVL